MKFLALGIFLLVSGAVFLTAAFVVRMSIMDDHSNVRFVRGVPSTMLAALTAALPPSPHAEVQRGDEDKVQSAEPCPPAPLTETRSLVDYLRSKHVDTSFEARAEFAREYGIANYTGSMSQNRELLRFLASEGDSAHGQCFIETARY